MEQNNKRVKFVTLTGADNSVSHEELFALSEEFPFVEWAILFSQSKSGEPRYPSHDWVLDLVRKYLNLPPKDLNFNFAAHLCGKWVDDIIKGEFTFLRDPVMSCFFRRIQLNLSKGRLSEAFAAFKRRLTLKPIIFGSNYAAVSPDPSWFNEMGASPLFDASGGRGILTKQWPKPLYFEGKPMFCGYAGGLGPDNVSEEITRVLSVDENMTIWIDMESSLRKNDKFDLDKCWSVLEQMRPWITYA